MKKQWWKSKTLWTAAASFITVICSEVFADPNIAKQVEQYVAILLPFVMAILRKATKTELTK